jgi:hypothetical protein
MRYIGVDLHTTQLTVCYLKTVEIMSSNNIGSMKSRRLRLDWKQQMS